MNTENQIRSGIFMYGTNAGLTEEIYQLAMAKYIKLINRHNIILTLSPYNEPHECAH